MANYLKFIAGAICPSCHKFDKLSYRKQNNSETIECVQCGYSQTKDHSTVVEETS
jgi:uncharacterized metal-binding protein (TIGR02443 family)